MMVDFDVVIDVPISLLHCLPILAVLAAVISQR